jgi:hypothetical protein
MQQILDLLPHSPRVTRTRLQRRGDSFRRWRQGDAMESAGAGSAANCVNKDNHCIHRKFGNKGPGAGCHIANLANVTRRSTKLVGDVKAGGLV